jgi:hypothetical protein
MDLFDAVRANFLNPAVLFFILGAVATLARSDLKFPEALYITLTIYLLVAIGFKGGSALSSASFAEVWKPGLAAILLGAAIPLWSYPVLRLGGLSQVDAAAIAAHYGSVSAVTFMAATNLLKQLSVPFEEHAAAFLALMESPAIVVGIVLGRMGTGEVRSGAVFHASLPKILHEALLGRSVLLLVGALIIGAVTGKQGMEMTQGFFVTPFQGVLALFLLEMGMVAARRISDFKKVGFFLAAFGMAAPIVHGFVGVAVGHAVGLSVGGATLMGVLSASASYIAAPAAVRLSLPDANPTLYLTSALAITFPFNITVGVPACLAMARWWNS